jgi:hypothetical protein
MSERYAALLSIWKTCNAEARAAEMALNQRFEAFLAGKASEPGEAERAQVARLHERERAALEAALDYVRRTARSGPR